MFTEVIVGEFDSFFNTEVRQRSTEYTEVIADELDVLVLTQRLKEGHRLHGGWITNVPNSSVTS